MQNDKKKSFNPVHAYQWRKLYRIMHEIRDTVDMTPTMPATNSYKPLNKVYTIARLMKNLQESRRMSTLADDLAIALFTAVVRNNYLDADIKWDEMPATAKYHFIQRVTMDMHKIFQQDYGRHDALRAVLYLRKYEITEDGIVSATFFDDVRHIVIYESQVDAGFYEVLDTIAHEYTHALQNVGQTQIPPFLSQYTDMYWDKYCEAPTHLRPEEIEAMYVADLAGIAFKDIAKQYKEYKQKQTTH